jgi:hypothetical protein
MDLFTTQQAGKRFRALMGFATRHGIFESDGYTSGLHSRNAGFAADINSHFQEVLWKRALDHIHEEQARKRLGDLGYCRCVDFYDKSIGSLAPLRPK